MSNSEKMSLEERLVQHLKDDKLTILMDDESAITELVRRAIEESLYQKRKVMTGGYGNNYTEVDSLVVAEAKLLIKEKLGEMITEEIKKLQDNKEVMDVIKSSMLQMLPVIIKETMTRQYDSFVVGLSMEAANRLKEIKY